MVVSGVVVAVTHPGNATCVACLDEKTLQLTRPTQSQGGPFWTSPEVASLQVGCRVQFQPTGLQSESRLPHRNEDVPCVSLKQGGSVAAPDEVYLMLSHVAERSIGNVWPKSVWSSDRYLKADVDVPSIAIIHGSIESMQDHGQSLRANLELGTAGLVRNVPVTCAALTQKGGEEQVQNKFGLLILGLARPKVFHENVRSDHEQCAVMLIGWLPAPENTDMWCIPRSLCTSIFLLSDRAGLTLGDESAHFDKEYIAFLQLVQKQPLNLGWEFDKEDKQALGHLCELLQGAEPAVEMESDATRIARDAPRGCFVVVGPGGSGFPPGHRTVSVVEVTRRSGWKRGSIGSDAILATEMLDEEQLGEFVKSFTSSQRTAATPAPYLQALQKATEATSERTEAQLLALASSEKTVDWGRFPHQEITERTAVDEPEGAIKRTARPLVPSAKSRPAKSAQGEICPGWSRSEHWSCLKAVAYFVLSQITLHQRPHELYKKLQAAFLLHLLQRQVCLLSPETATPQRLRVAMEMMRKATSKVAKLHRDFLPPSASAAAMTARCTEIRQTLDALLRARGGQKALEFKFDSAAEVIAEDVCFTVDVPTGARQFKPANRDPKTRANKNLQGFLLFEHERPNFENILQWLKGLRWQDQMDTVKMQVGLASVEELFLGYAKRLEEDWSECDLQSMEDLLDEYGKLCERFESLTQWKVELRSRQTLVQWIGCCLVWRVAELEHPLVEKYGPAIRPEQLRRLSLSKVEQIDALKAVDHFLKSRCQNESGLFNLSDQEPTFLFAAEFGAASGDLQHILNMERGAEKIRMSEHWEQVKKQQAEAKVLRKLIAELKPELCTKETELTTVSNMEQKRQSALEEVGRIDSSIRNLYSAGHQQWERERKESELGNRRKMWFQDVSKYEASLAALPSMQTLEREIESLKAKLSKARADLKFAETPPHAVIQSLPEDCDLANSTLFFLYTPDLMRLLSCMTVKAQQMLLPWPWCCDQRWDVRKHLAVENFESSWADHFEAPKKYYNPPNKPPTIHVPLKLLSREEPPSFDDETKKGKHIDHLTGPRDGVWWPDNMHREIACKSDGRLIGHGEFFDPFVRLPDSFLTEHWTERMPKTATDLQWIMKIGDEIETTRGNQPLATQRDKPQWLRKHEYLALCTLRAFPHQQLRKLLAALEESSLPLMHEGVHCLLRQLLYHVGPFADDGQLLWKRDLPGLMDEFQKVLSTLAEEFSAKPRAHQALPAVADLFNYFIQWKSCSSMAASTLLRGCRKLSETALKWARDTLSQMQEGMATDHQDELVAKVKLFGLYAALCTPSSTLTMEDAKRLVKGLVFAQNSTPVKAQVKPDEKEMLECLHGRVESVIADKIAEVIEFAKSSDEFITACTAAALEDVPTTLLWRQCDTMPCFHAEDQGRLYSINLLKGIVLLDGNPPRCIPHSVVQHSLYKRCFGDAVFEVSMDKSGTFKTSRPVDGCFYEFQELSGGNLRITEMTNGRSLHLVPTEFLGEEFPERLVELHSHWRDPTSDVVLFRPVHFRERSIHFLYIPQGRAADRGVCLQIPEHLRTNSPEELRKHPDVEQQLVCQEAEVMDILDKFEDRAFIHQYIFRGAEDENNVKQLELPRVNMAFNRDCGQWMSRDYRGYCLADEQKLPDTLIDFDAYLVLKRVDPNDLSIPDMKIIVKDADVEEGVPLSLVSDSNSHSQQSTVCFDVHDRFKHLVAETVQSRLLLAALYAGTDCGLPDPRLGVTGMEAAMGLVRQSWVNRPLSKLEMQRLQSILQFSARAPMGLDILCRDLLHSSSQLAHLHGLDATDPEGAYHEHQFLVHAAYLKEAQNVRCWLTPEEERRCFVTMRNGRKEERRTQQTVDVEELPELPVPASYVEDAEEDLQNYVYEKLVSEDAPSFPLKGHFENKIGKEIMEELQNSWKVHHETEQFRVTAEGCKVELWQEKLKDAIDHRQQISDYLRRSLEILPSGTGSSESEIFQVRVASNKAVKATPRDFLEAALQPDILRNFNPFLSEAAVKNLHTGILLLLKLQVLEDKYKRLLIHAQGEVYPLLLQELLVTRCWDAATHPEWLVFEVEEGLQIRPVQYEVAKKLIEDPGCVVQLNMGEGKTRVILPMLILHWAGKGDQRLLRITALTSLINELFDFLHRHLCASVLRRKIFLLPFHRDVQLTEQDLRVMMSSMEFCRQSGGVLLVAPEHRLSLQLKWHELRLQGEQALCDLLGNFFALPSRDCLDESDEVLRHKYQLIYAVGSPMPLPEGHERWNVATALLRVLQESHRVWNLVDPSTAVTENGDCEVFKPLRFIPGEELDAIMPRLRVQLVEDLMEDPPPDFPWLKNYCSNTAVVSFLTSPEADNKTLPDILKDRLAVMLALRGFLACSVLEHCLTKRHSVDYGIRRSHGKRLAVPYRASNTPAERSEFGHPDCALVLTLLSYFYDGLSRSELQQAFKTLLACDESIQESHYNVWFRLSSERMTPEERATVERVSMVDLSNASQFEVLYEYYHKNFETIAFWVCHCLFPSETSQFPQKLLANAWHLADNPDGLVGGFSGTDDNQRALPLQVTQQNLPKLSGTNGKMIFTIMENPQFQSLELGEDGTLHWKQVLHAAASGGVDALIDCGALTAGATNKQIAEELLDLLMEGENKFRGVTFFDTSKKEWMILENHGRCLPKKSSPAREAECFAFFDEARSRGADLKLAMTARAMVTVGPKCGKDKLMQAVGRMRQLDKGQTLEFIASPEVTKKIQDLMSHNTPQEASSRPRRGRTRSNKSKEITSQHLLEWVVANTVQAAEDALTEWAKQGMLFTTTCANPDLAVLDETVELNSFYKEALVPQPVPEVIESEMKMYKQRAGRARLDSINEDLLREIQNRAERYGEGIKVICNVLDEEYERELEIEKEVEKELERQVPSAKPRPEEDWEVSKLLTAQYVKDLGVKVLTLPKIFSSTESLKGIKSWPDAAVFATKNFHQTILGPENLNMDDYLRPVDAVIAFPGSKELLLLSEREADRALDVFWKATSCGSECQNFFVNWVLWRNHFRSNLPGSLPSAVQGTVDLLEDASRLVSIQAFMGDTKFKQEAQQKQLEELIAFIERGCRDVRAVKEIVNVRGLVHRYERSDLAWILNSRK